jgi:hypothetical protein
MERSDRIVLGLFAATIVATLAVVGFVVASRRDRTGTVAYPVPAGPSCDARVDRGVLPTWARTGFSDPEPRVPHVIGRRGELAAILFGDPLSAPPDPDRSNKILWVARETPEPGPLRLEASARGRVVRRVVESGPGPSIVDLPAGCWTVEARWRGGVDELDLRYAPG